MRSVHVLGLGMLAGAIALGAMISVVTYRWQVEAFPESQPAVASAHASPGALATAIPAGDVSQGQTLFNARCSACHTIGGGKKAGPDLQGVASRRSRDWLIAFITAPDQVIASGDPTASQLVKEYGMPMPNVGVTRSDAEAILAYIASR